jgi:hypothetical protein
MKPLHIAELTTCHNDSEVVTVVHFNDQYHVPVAGKKHLYFTPYETAKEAFSMQVVIRAGIPSGRGYYIVLPIGTKKDTVCRCLGKHNPFYFEVKRNITADDFAQQNRFWHALDKSKQAIMESAYTQRHVIVGYCDSIGSVMRLYTSYVEPVDMEQEDDWAITLMPKFVL